MPQGLRGVSLRVCDTIRGVKSFLRTWRLRKTFLLGIPRFCQVAVSKCPPLELPAEPAHAERPRIRQKDQLLHDARHAAQDIKRVASTKFRTASTSQVPGAARVRHQEDQALKHARGVTRVLFRPRLNERIQ